MTDAKDDNTDAEGQSSKPAAASTPQDPWTFLAQIKSLLSVFKKASVGQQVLILAMLLVAVLFVAGGVYGIFRLESWAVVVMFVVAAIAIMLAAIILFRAEQIASTPFRCRHVPVYPPNEEARVALRAALEEIRNDAVDLLQSRVGGIDDIGIRANIFLLAPIEGGADDGTWKLVIHRDLAINMSHPPELDLQLSIGQGATGVAYRDGQYKLTRRLAAPPKKTRHWDRVFKMTPALERQIHPNLKWILSFPLLKGDSREAVGVVNIDGLYDVPNDEDLYWVSGSLQDKVRAIADHLSLQRSVCVGLDKLESMK